MNGTGTETVHVKSKEEKAQERETKRLEKQQERAAKALKKQEEREAKLAEKEAKREEQNKAKEAERAAKAEQKAAERESKAAEKAAEREAAKAAKAEEKAAERAKAAEQREADKLAKAEERKAAQEAAKAEREEAKAKAKQEKADAKAQAKLDRKAAAEGRKLAIEERRNETKSAGSRRARATHFIYTGEGLSQPQAHSVRGKVFQYIKDHCEIGVPVDIASFGEEVKHMLYGSSIRSFLSKLEEMGHLDFTVLETQAPADKPEQGPEAGQDRDVNLDTDPVDTEEEPVAEDAEA
jgi:hypothetical protein